jgi:3-phenylpropionate/trans-cinnamate dioxygenase ferredoxin subunit
MTSQEHDIGHVVDYVHGTVRGVTVAGRALAIVRHGDRFFAVRDTCPHQGAALSNGSVTGDVQLCQVGDTQQYARDGEVLRCPWHGWQFELRTGKSLVDPEHTRIRSYPVRVEKDRVLVAMGDSFSSAASEIE